MRDWWLGLEARERRTLSLAAAVLVAMLFYFVLWLPPHRAIAELHERLPGLRADVAWMRQAADEARVLQQRAGATPANARGDQALYSLADETARKAGLADAIERVEPSGDQQVRVNLRGASFDDMVRWLGGLRHGYGVGTDSLSVRSTDRPGRVDVQLVLTGGAP